MRSSNEGRAARCASCAERRCARLESHRLIAAETQTGDRLSGGGQPGRVRRHRRLVPSGPARDRLCRGSERHNRVSLGGGPQRAATRSRRRAGGRKVDVIFTSGGILAALAAKQATGTIPIVFESGIDPVEKGLVASYARPGGNLTGVTILTADLMPKRLEVLSELVPRARSIALLVNPNNGAAERMVGDVQKAAEAKQVQLRVVRAAAEEQFEPAFEALVQAQADALLVGNDPFFFSRRER